MFPETEKFDKWMNKEKEKLCKIMQKDLKHWKKKYIPKSEQSRYKACICTQYGRCC